MFDGKFDKFQNLLNHFFLLMGLNGGALTFDANLHPTHTADVNISLIAELVKTMVGLSLSIISALFYYITQREKINAYFKGIKWLHKKPKVKHNKLPPQILNPDNQDTFE